MDDPGLKQLQFCLRLWLFPRLWRRLIRPPPPLRRSCLHTCLHTCLHLSTDTYDLLRAQISCRCLLSPSVCFFVIHALVGVVYLSCQTKRSTMIWYRSSFPPQPQSDSCFFQQLDAPSSRTALTINLLLPSPGKHTYFLIVNRLSLCLNIFARQSLTLIQRF